MTDLKTMIDAMPLQENKAEIERQFDALAGHGDGMKLVILMMLLFKSSPDTIKAIEPNKLEGLQTELQRDVVNLFCRQRHLQICCKRCGRNVRN